MKKKITLKVTDLSKNFKIYHEKPALVNIWKKKRFHDLWALRNINFEVSEGETVSIIGRNGSGKSTLLKILCRVMTPTSGSVKSNGQIASLLELGSGFHPELTGRENVFLNASIMNLSKKEINKKFNDIVAFAQLEDFIDTSLYTYSSGMYMRLGFAIAVFSNFDILIIDEILSVGDIGFQEKCFDKIREFKNSGKTIVFVTHDMGVAEKISDRILWLDKGKLIKGKEKQYILDSYRKMFFKEEEQEILVEENKKIYDLNTDKNKDKKIPRYYENLKRWGSYDVEITNVSFYNQFNKKTRIFNTNDEFRVKIEYIAHKKIKNPVFGIAIFSDDGIHITGPNTQFSNYKIKYIEGNGYIEYKVSKLLLLQGVYLLSMVIYGSKSKSQYDYHNKMYKFKVSKGKCKEIYGKVKIPCKWVHKRR